MLANSKEYMKEWRKAHAVEIKEYDANYRKEHAAERRKYSAGYTPKYTATHKTEKAQYDAAYRKLHKERIAERKAEYGQLHREEKAKYDAAYRESHKEIITKYQTEYQRKHLPEYAARNAKRRALIRGTIDNATPRQLAEIVEVYRKAIEDPKVRCYLCGKLIPIGHRHVDHIIPLSKGGTSLPSNLAVACDTCNLHKSDKLPEEIGLLI